YPAVSVAPQPPPPVQPQQYSPVAPRYPTPVPNTSNISPCYPTAGPPPSSAHDMRSPQLMSPTQAPIVPAGVPQAAPPTMVAPVPANAPPPPMQRNIPSKLQTNGTSIAPQQHMQRMVPQSAPFYGHEPNIANNVSPDMCLIGCFFIVVEHERVLVDRLDLQEISAIVRLHGGEIEIGPRAYTGANSERITHVICESLRNQLVQQCISMLMNKYSFQIIAINGFSHNERSGIRMMIIAIGARFTPYLTKHNHFLITKTSVYNRPSRICLIILDRVLILAEGAKVEKSRELGVTVVNYQWLIELYLGMKTSIQENESAYCPVPGMFPEVNVSPYTLELYSEVCKQLLAAWRKPVIFSPDQWQRAAEVKRSVENDESIFPNKKLRMSTPPPTDEQIVEQRAQLGPLKDAPIVCFSGFTAEEVSALEKKVRFLGCQVTDCVSECTHLVVLNLWRTMKLLEAIALGKNIVGANWVTDGYRYRVIPDTLDYFARDDENEKAFGYNLKYSVLRARYRRVFEVSSVAFHVRFTIYVFIFDCFMFDS
ncbi:unnamed protein product, partial [Anisakis simplex]|uniref:PAX-interacting protein 1 n=1 Tax=Anisakis simplex TaxID=6269 RepID=A0A0M3K0V4_ANISI